MEKERKKENRQPPKGGMGGRYTATTQGLFKERGVWCYWRLGRKRPSPFFKLGAHTAKPREWHQRQERRALAAPRSCTECARSVCHGHRLRHCSRAARRRRSISRAHPMRAHIVRSRGQVAVHGRTPAVAAHMPPAVLLVIDLRIGTAAGCCCCSSSSLLLPHSV